MAITAADKLAAVTAVHEPPDLNYQVTPVVMWNYRNGVRYQEVDLTDQVTGLRVDLNTQQASTVEIDLEDSDFTILSNTLFANWAFNIEDVSVSSQRKFKTTRLSNSTNTTYLGNESDLEWVLGQRPIDIEVGGVYFRLCSIQAQQTTVTLGFEDRTASLLRDKSGAKSWNRAQHTRAQFVAMLCREAGVDYWIPEINIAQPVEINVTNSGGSTTTVVTGHSIGSAAGLTVKGSQMSPTQQKYANMICQIGEKLNAPSDAIVALLFDAIYETSLGGDTAALNSPNSGGYQGLLQAPAGAYPDTPSMITAAYKGDTHFTSAISLAKQQPGNIAWIGSQCTRPVPYDSKGISTQYEGQKVPGGISGTVTEAQNIYASYGGPRTTGSSRTTSSSKNSYAFTRGPNEDSWDCIQRLAAEVAWYAFVRQNKLWYVSGNYLFQQDGQLTCEVNKDGVRWIDVNLDMGARDQIAQCDVYAQTDLWAALPGMIVNVRNRGPATGRWFVSEVQSQPLDPTQNAQITLYKPVPKRSEPVNNSTGNPSTAGLSQGIGTVTAAYQAAKALSAKNTVYTQSVRTLVPLSQVKQGATMFDCSASVSEVLALAGFPLPGGATFGSWAPVSGDFTPGQAGLVAGPGKQMTIWGGPTHVFIEFNIPGVGHFQGNTVSGQSGFRLISWDATFTGGWGGPNPGAGGAGPFAPVHYPGT